MGSAWFYFFSVCGLNAIPAVGWFVADWTPGTTLLLYWYENVASALFIAARIILHRRWTRCVGHFDYQAPESAKGNSLKSASYLQSYLAPVLVFSAAHGIFLFLLIGIMLPRNFGSEAGVSLPGLLKGCGMVTVLLALNFAMDLPSLSTRPFLWMERMGQRSLARVVVIHLTIIFGMMIVAFSGAVRGFFGVFIGFKALIDLGGVFPQREMKDPPAWLSGIMDRVKPRDRKASFADFWHEGDKKEHARQERNERKIGERKS